MYPKVLEELISCFKKYPTIGEKSAERLALATLDLSEDELNNFSNTLIKAKKVLKPCKICCNLTDKDICDICNDENRNKNIICVVEDYKSLISFEKAGNYKGVYHVLNGLISPIDNVSPQDINISSLVKRIEKLDKPEIIIALRSSIEGQTTTLYIKQIFENKGVTISRLSYGIPMGAEIDYLDVLTLDKALSDRKIIS
ncbi:MAG: recombination mediator RecR [Bacilli bacterium]|nr:recombination mediator RecR [Mycoplasma sp.]MDY4544470.1 recombination mediator RecR [Bacilli bacterium]MDY4619344.1 recombination mediator RecR [Bacilli bacterium]